MQKIKFILICCLMWGFGTVQAQFTESFEGGIPATWAVINGGSTNTWQADPPGAGTANTGTNVAEIIYDASVAHDDYLVTEQFTVTAGVSDRLSLYHKQRSNTFPEPFDVLLSSTGAAAADFTTTLATAVASDQTVWTFSEYNLTPYLGQTVYIAFYISTTNEFELYLDDIAVDALPSCPDPSALLASNITATSADLAWTENGSATAWDVELVDITGGGTATGTVTANDITNPYMATGLTSANTYEYYVRSDCGMDDTDVSAWVGPFSFTTACNTFIAPYSENFDNAGTIPNCWGQGAGNAEDWLFADGSAAEPGHGENAGAIVDHTSGTGFFAWVDDSGAHNTGTTLESPFVDVSSLTTPALMFWMNSDNEGNTNVDFSVDFYDGAAWNTGVFTSNTNTASWAEVVINLSTYTITGPVQARFIVDENNGTDFYDDVAIDDVSFDELPACPNPNTLAASNITAMSADLSWMENGTATAWDIEVVDITGGGAVTGTATANDVTNPYTAMGLSSANAYEYYVRADCGMDDTNVSGWVGPFAFFTACNVISIFPACESFDSGSALESCWSVIDANGDGDAWDLNYTLNTNTGDQVAVINTDFNGGADDDYLVSPQYTLTGGEQISFFQRVQSAGEPNDFEVLLSTTGNAAADFTTTILPLATYSNIAYQELIIDLSAYTGNVYIAFHIPSGGSDGWRLYIDDVCVEPIPTCPDPTTLAVSNITSMSADLAWMENGTATAWDIEVVDITGGGAVTGTATANDVTNPYTAMGLSSANAYEYYVRADCGMDDTDVSAWVGPFAFFTACNAISTFPACESFDSGSALEGCWSVIDANGDGDAWDLNYTLNTNTGDQVAVINTDFNGGADDDYLVSPQYTLTGGEQISFFQRVQSAGEPNDFEVLLSTTGNAAADFTTTILPLATYSNIAYQELIIDLSAYTGNVYIAFHIPSGGSDGWRLYIDDVCVEPIPTCPAPTALAVSNITSMSADLAWTENGTATAWDIEIVDITAGGTATGTVTANDVTNPYTAIGLTPNNDYEYYVRADCGMDDTDVSTWVGPFAFFTLCAPEAMTCAMDYMEDFGTVATPTADCYLVSGGPATGPTGPATTQGWYFNEFANDGSGSNSSVLNLYNLGTEDWLFSPEFDLTAGGPYEMTMDIALTTYNATTAGTLGSDDQVQVLITNDAGATWTSLETWDNTSVVSNTSEPRTYDLTAYAGQTVQFGFWGTEGAVDDAGDMEFHIDNVRVGCAITTNPCVDGYETGGGNQLTGTLDMNADYETDQGIDSDQMIGLTTPAIGVDYDAAIDIDLLPGFEVALGVTFDAFIDGCQGGTDNGAGGNQVNSTPVQSLQTSDNELILDNKKEVGKVNFIPKKISKSSSRQ